MPTLSSTARWDYIVTILLLDLRNLERLPTDGDSELCNRLARELNEQAERIEEIFLDIATDPKSTHFGWEETLTWRTKQEVLRRRGLSKKEIGDDEFGHLSKKEQDEDEKAYQAFLANEFSEVA